MIAPPDDTSDKRRNQKLAWARTASENVRDIGPPPPVVESAERDLILADPVAFLKVCWPDIFALEFSDDHIEVIHTLERVSIDGGLFALAMPRGSGKTQISIRMALRAILLGRRRYACIIGAAQSAAVRIIKALKTELCWNAKLHEHFPVETHGFPQLQGDNRRAGGQVCLGEKTDINLSVEQIIWPHVPGSIAAGSIITSCGLTGNVRGQFHTLKSGGVLRPDLAILDDPQTKESAKSAAQNQERIEIIEGDVLGLAGPTKSIACVMPCTVIEQGDLADRMLQHKQWNGKRTKTLYDFPKNMALWDEYFQVRGEGLRVHKSSEAGDQFYLEHREALDEGARLGWPAKVTEGDISGIQSAMHLWYRSPTAFAAEYQNEPVDAASLEDRPTCKPLVTKLTRLPRGVVPLWATHLTAGIDIQKRLLYYTVIAWADDFTGAIIEYGAYPDQARSYFTLSEAHPTLQSASAAKDDEGAIWWGLEKLSERLAKDWPVEGGNGTVRIERALVDYGWGEMSDLVFEFLRRTPHKFLLASKGKGINAGGRPMDDWKRRPGEKYGLNWMISTADNARKMRRETHDTNWWKTFVATRCAAAAGSPGSLSVYGEREEQHRLLVDQLTAEAPIKTFGNGRELWEWKSQPGADNHLLDCCVMASVAASIGGASLDRLRTEAKPVKRSSIPAHMIAGRAM